MQIEMEVKIKQIPRARGFASFFFPLTRAAKLYGSSEIGSARLPREFKIIYGRFVKFQIGMSRLFGEYSLALALEAKVRAKQLAEEKNLNRCRFVTQHAMPSTANKWQTRRRKEKGLVLFILIILNGFSTPFIILIRISLSISLAPLASLR